MPVAHRGLHGPGAPENSLAAFLRAADRGYAIELDVRLSRDGVAVVVHDDALLRLTGVSVSVSSSTAEALGALSLLGSGEGVPTLGAVLAAVDGRAPLLIEVKRCATPITLAKAVAGELGGYAGPAAVQSFSLRILILLRLFAPGWRRGLLSGPDQDRLSPLCGRRVLRSVARLLSGYTFEGLGVLGAAAGDIAQIRTGLAYPVLLWTVKDSAWARFAAAHGCNPIFEGIDPAALQDCDPGESAAPTFLS